MKREPVLLAGITPLITALGVRLARINWPLAGLWDDDHARALTAALRVGGCAFPDPQEPLAQAGYVLLGCPRPEWLGPAESGLIVIATCAEAGESAWLSPLQPVSEAGQELLGLAFEARGAGMRLAEVMGLTCSIKQV